MQCSSSSCSSGCGGHVVACPCPESGNPEINSLEKIISCFWQRHQEVAVEREYFENLDSFGTAIAEAAAALGDENLGYDRPDVISPEVLTTAARQLVESESALAACQDFDALFGAVERVIGHLDGLTMELVYLTALRIGLQAGLHPEKIYLEAGAADGAAALVEINGGQETLSRSSLPPILQHQEITVADIQSCLAICRNQLQWLTTQMK